MAAPPVSLRTEPPRNNSFQSYSGPTEDSAKLLPTDALCRSPPIRLCGALAHMADSQIQMPCIGNLKTTPHQVGANSGVVASSTASSLQPPTPAQSTVPDLQSG